MSSRATSWQDRRPDPSEPWRYLCPHCAHYSLSRVHRVTPGPETFECLGCHKIVGRDELVDRLETSREQLAGSAHGVS